MCPERHEDDELVAVGAQEVDERPRCVRIAAERVQDERQPVLLPDRFEVAGNLPEHIWTYVRLQVLTVARDVREHTGLKLGPDLLENR